MWSDRLSGEKSDGEKVKSCDWLLCDENRDGDGDDGDCYGDRRGWMCERKIGKEWSWGVVMVTGEDI